MTRRVVSRIVSTVALAAIFVSGGCERTQSQPTQQQPVVALEPVSGMKVLELRVGTWDAKSSAKPAVWTPDGMETTGVEKIELILKGLFIEGKAVNSDKSESTWLATYDEPKNAYRFWFFNSFGATSESTGQWDDKTKTLTWSHTTEEGITMVAHWRYIDNDTHDWDALAKDKNGKVYLDMKGKLTRKK